MTITAVQESDNSALASLIRQAFEEHGAPKEGTVYSDPTTDNLYVSFKHERAVLWVAKEAGEILGCCGIYPTPGLPSDCAELVKFYLLSKARGKGIGRALMQRSFSSAIELGYSALYLESMPQFSKAVSMYEKLGFRRLEKPLGQSGHVSCDIWMIKQLDTAIPVNEVAFQQVEQ